MYICGNWKLYYTLVESPIYLITISSHKISFRKVECSSGEVAIGNFNHGNLSLGWDLIKLCKSVFLTPQAYLSFQISGMVYIWIDHLSLSTGQKKRDQLAFKTLFLNPHSKTMFVAPFKCFLELLTLLWFLYRPHFSMITYIHSFVKKKFYSSNTYLGPSMPRLWIVRWRCKRADVFSLPSRCCQFS